MPTRKVSQNKEEEVDKKLVSKEDGPRAKRLKAIQHIVIKKLVNFFEDKESFQKKFGDIASSRPELFGSIQKKIVEDLQTSLQQQYDAMDDHLKIIAQINEIDQLLAAKDENNESEKESDEITTNPFSHTRINAREREKKKLEELLHKLEEENQTLRNDVQQLQNNKRKSDQALGEITNPLLKSLKLLKKLKTEVPSDWIEEVEKSGST